MKISLVYLGKQGGGALLTENAYRFGRVNGQVNRVLVSSKNELLTQFEDCSRVSTIAISHNYRSILKVPVLVLAQIYKSVKWAVKTRDDLIVFVMPSPFDLVTMLIIRLMNRKIVFVCHETSSHYGEIWPTEKSITRRARLSELIVSLSPEETEKIVKKFTSGKVKELWHPIFTFSLAEQPSEFDFDSLKSPIFLFVGRFKAYKGIERLISAWDGNQVGSLILAGSGKFDFHLPRNVHLINRWLSEGEIAYLVEKADVLVFPYTSASQSGLIPFARSKGKMIIASRISGFVDQLEGYADKTTWIESHGILSLRRALAGFSEISTPGTVLEEMLEEDRSMVAFLSNIQETWFSRQTT